MERVHYKFWIIIIVFLVVFFFGGGGGYMVMYGYGIETKKK